jgi:urease accessory protein UreF
MSKVGLPPASLSVGAFSHSSGLAWTIEAGDVTDAESLHRWLAVHGEFVIMLRLASGTVRDNGAAKRRDQGRHGREAVCQIVLPECRSSAANNGLSTHYTGLMTSLGCLSWRPIWSAAASPSSPH